MILLWVKLIKNLEEGQVYGAPAAKAGEVISVPFQVGASLIAAEFAEAAEAPAPKQSKK